MRSFPLSLLVLLGSLGFTQAQTEVLPGVWRFTYGTPEKITPTSTRHYPPATNGLAALPAVTQCPVTINISHSDRGCLVQVPLAPEEMIYGLGLQFQSFQQRGLRKTLRVNADPAMDTGDSHAPVPFYVTTRGYGVFIDTARYATFYLGNVTASPAAGKSAVSGVLVEVPEAAGVDVYVFGGPTLGQAVQRYNLYSGGGPVPPRWGLGFWYRGKGDFNQTNVLEMAAEFRDRHIPLDVFGLEPGWQTHAYSDSYRWSSLFPDPKAMLAQLAGEHVQVNLWEHAFVHPTAPIYTALLPHSGNYEVWGGLVPDFIAPEAREIFASYHGQAHVNLGAAGYKLDECDNSDYTGNWSFPALSRFPSGADGEQMHSLFGLRYQDAIQSVFDQRGRRTYGLVRSSGALAAPYPYVLYSDLYDHRQFVRGVAAMGFSGLLWTPEVRDSANPAELLRRLESTVFSPLAIINAWYLKNPPWKQVNRDANNNGQFAEGWEKVEAQCRDILDLRMKFIPYLHAAFVRYHQEGLPPFRALVMDYPDDPQTRNVDDEYLMGDNLLVAPIIAGDNRPAASRTVYLPAGDWYDFWTGERLAGGRSLTVEKALEQIPLYVKSGTVLPLAEPTASTADPASRQLQVTVYGDGSRPATLFEDDDSGTPSLAPVRLEWDAAQAKGSVIRSTPTAAGNYEIKAWSTVK